MVSQDYNLVAKRLIDLAKRMPNYPQQQLMLLKWRKEQYFGSVQETYPEYSKEIVYLSKTSNPIHSELADCIRKIEPSVLEIVADDELDLEGRGHVLRRLENKLTQMTPEQTKYAIKNPLNITELDS